MTRVLRGGLAAALVLFLLASGAVPALAADWTDFGGTPERRHRAEEQATLPASPDDWFWTPDVGVSCSQPLVVGDTLYVLAAKGETGTPAAAGLYAFDLRAVDESPAGRQLDPLPGFPVRLNADPRNCEPSQGHVTYDPATGGFYWGTADGCLAAWKPGMPEPVFQPLYRSEPGDTRVVSAPLVLSPDVVALGTAPAPGRPGSGGVWVVRGLLESRASRAVWDWIPAAVTSSFVKVSADRFLVGVDGIGGRGEVRCYQVTADGLSLVTTWGDNGRVVTPAGVPASFAVEGPYFYFSDKYGTFYKAGLATGKVVWSRRFDSIAVQDWFARHVRLADPSGAPFPVWIPDLPDIYSLGPGVVSVPGDRLFVNHSPAVGDGLVYWTVRTSDRTSERGTAGWAAPGLLLALSKADGSLRWAVKLPGNGNTCALVWPYARRVLVGTRDYQESRTVKLAGWITCWDSEDGRPRMLVQNGDWGWWGLGLLQNWWNPLPGSPPWSQLSGTGVEITLTRGVLVTGAGAVSGSALVGSFRVIRLPDPVNLRVQGAVREPSGAVEPGGQVTVRALVELAQGTSAVDTWVGWRWKGETEWRKVQDVTLGPDRRQVEVSFQVSAPSATQTLEVKVNPDELHPAAETDYRDNAAEVTVEVREPEPPLDLALAMVYPKELWVGMVTKVFVDTWTAQGPGAATEVVFTCNGRSASKRVTLPAGKPGAVVRAEFGVEALSPGTLHLQAVVNPGRNPAEVRYDNNRYAADVPVHGLINPPGDGEVRVWLIR